MKMLIKRMLWLIMACLLLAAGTAFGEGSWAYINQPMERPENWQQWVENSPFALGGKMALEQKTGEPILFEQSYGSYPCLDGSTVMVPLAMELARQHLQIPENDLSGFVAFSTTHNAYERLIQKKPNLSPGIASEHTVMEESRPVDMILATEPSDEELKMAAETGVVLKKEPICYDAFVFLVNVKNPVANLTLDEIRKIYIGQVQNWQPLGGKDAAITPFQRQPNSGSQTAMENLVMKGVPMEGAVWNYVSDGMSELVAQIGDYDNGENSIGYSYLYYLENLYKSDQVKVLALDGVTPAAENIRSGKYPLTTCYYAVYREGDALGEAFTEWLLSQEGQKCLAQAGYIPLSE